MFRFHIETHFLRVLTSVFVLSSFNLYVSNGNPIRGGIARIYDPCFGLKYSDNNTEDTDQSSDFDMFPIRAVVEEFRIVVTETLDILDFLLDMYVLSDCTNSTVNENTHVRLTNCRVYEFIISHNFSYLREHSNYPEFSAKEELIDFTGDFSLVILLTDLLKMSEAVDLFKSNYDIMYQKLMSSFCVLSDVWDGEERSILHSVTEFYHEVKTHFLSRRGVEITFSVMRLLRERLANMAESLSLFYQNLTVSFIPIRV